MNHKKRKLIDWLIVGIQVLATVFLSVSIFNLGFIPINILLIGIAILAGLLLIIGLPLIFMRRGKFKVFLRIVSLVLSVGLLVTGFYYVSPGSQLVKRITGVNYETNVVGAYVLKDSSLEKIEDAKDVNFAYKESKDDAKTYINEAIDDINKKLNTEIKTQADGNYESLLDDLYSGEVDVILINETEMTFIEYIKESFAQDTRLIYSYERQVAIDNIQPLRIMDVTKDTFTMYISGIDTYGPVSTRSRTDVNMLMTVNPKKRQILLTSIPRDYYVELASKGAMDKLTHSGNFGINESVETLEKLLDIDIDYYARLNFTSVVEIVDALDGVDVYSHYDFTASSLEYSFVEGYNYVYGAQALSFVRERYAVPGGDNTRLVHQQELIIGIIDKLISPTILTNYNSILESLGSSIQLSMPSSDFTKLIKMQLEEGGSWDIQRSYLTGTGSSSTETYSMPGLSVYVTIPDEESVQAAHDLIVSMYE